MACAVVMQFYLPVNGVPRCFQERATQEIISSASTQVQPDTCKVLSANGEPRSPHRELRQMEILKAVATQLRMATLAFASFTSS
jgi:hypothetical protein